VNERRDEERVSINAGKGEKRREIEKKRREG